MSRPLDGDTPSRAGPQRIVAVGGGVATWMATAALAEALERRSVDIRVVGEGHERGSFEADSVLPLAAHGRLRTWRDEDRLIEAADGAFSLGIAVSGWAGRSAAWFHPFGPIGANLGPVPFHQLVMRLRHDGLELRLADYSLGALAAQAGRFTRPPGDARSVLSTCRYALHLGKPGLAEALRASAEAAGVEQVPGTFAGVERAQDGGIAAVRTSEGQRVEGDLFLDCTRAGALAGSGDWEDWSAWLPCDRRLAACMGTRGMPPSYSLAEAHAAGWTRQLPLRSTTVLTSFCCTGAGGERAALESLRRAAGPAELDGVESVALRCGRRREPWQGNCVALGPAASAIDPVAVGDLHLLQNAIARLLELLPCDRGARVEAREYNRRTGMELDNARDYAIALYKTNGRRGDAFWDDRRAMHVPESLEYRMRLYASLGRVALYDEEPLEDASWISLFDEQGLRPRNHHPIADGFATADLEAHVARVRAIMLEELRKMPAHGDYLDRLKAARPSRRSAAGGEATT